MISIYKPILEQIQRVFDADDKSRNYLEQKLAILIAQAAIYLGLLVYNYQYIYVLPISLVFFAIISYAIGIWPLSINDSPSSNSIIQILEDLKKNGDVDLVEDDIYIALICPDVTEKLKEAFIANNMTNELKRNSIRIGIILNILSLLIWIVIVIIYNL